MANLTPGNNENIHQLLSQHNFTFIKCPFTDFGCDQGKLKRDELNEHLQQESYRHSEILIGVIGDLRNELNELKRDREKYDTAIDKLVKSDREKAVIIDSMKEEIESMKLEKAMLVQRVDSLCNILDGKVDKTVLEQRVDNLGNILDGKIDKIVTEIESKLEKTKQELRGAMEQQQLALANVEERNELKYQTQIEDNIDSVDKCLPNKNNIDFIWTIDNIADKRQKRGWVHSQYFNGCTEPYTMQLQCYNATELEIYFRIVPGDSDEYLHWPFDKTVTIAIINRMRSKSQEAIFKQCTFAKPSNNSSWSDPFKFLWNDLSSRGLLHDNCLTVQCFIRSG